MCVTIYKCFILDVLDYGLVGDCNVSDVIRLERT